MAIDPTSLIGRAAEAGHKQGVGFGIAGSRIDGIDIRPVLMWLAGAGYRPKEVARNKGLKPTPRGSEEAADRAFMAIKPEEPVLATRMRADTLVDLYRDAIDDPRVESIFDADPVLAADPETGWLATETMLDARIGLFDSLNALLDKPLLTATACTLMRDTLTAAFGDLSPDSQREWCYSEVRLEQGLNFLESRQPSELLDLAEELRPVYDSRGIWDAMRLFSLAAQMSDMTGADTAPVANLLAMDDRHR